MLHRPRLSALAAQTLANEHLVDIDKSDLHSKLSFLPRPLWAFGVTSWTRGCGI